MRGARAPFKNSDPAPQSDWCVIYIQNPNTLYVRMITVVKPVNATKTSILTGENPVKREHSEASLDWGPQVEAFPYSTIGKILAAFAPAEQATGT